MYALSAWQFRRFLGITTEIMDDSSKETNLPMGSVTYAIPVKTEEAAVGDSILYQGDSKAYRYMITEMDKKNNIFKVIDDSSDKDAEAVTVEVKDYIPEGCDHYRICRISSDCHRKY